LYYILQAFNYTPVNKMEASLKSLCSRASLPPTCVVLALEYQRTLAAKQSSLGIGAVFQSTLCLHLSAIQAGKAVDTKLMVKLAGAKSKPHYLSIYQNVEKILDLDKVLSVQEVCVQLGVSHLSEKAGKVLSVYESHMKETFGEARCDALNLGKPVYPCAAVNAACKSMGEKIDLVKLCEISRGKKRDLLELSEEMSNLQTDNNDKSSTKKKLEFMDKIMGISTDSKENIENGCDRKVRGRIREEDFEDDGYEEWKEGILRKAVDEGYSKYKKYLKVKHEVSQ